MRHGCLELIFTRNNYTQEDIVNKGLKIFIGLLSIPLLVLGFKTMFDPTSMIEKWGTDPLGLTGLNSLRSMFPGILIGSGLMMQLGIRSNG